jgi:uncharacterized protein YndB with AHSA1/START domain
VWARAAYVPGLNGRTVEGRVLVQDGDAPPYQRYFSIFAHDDERDAWVAHTVHADGRVTSTDFALEDGVILTEWTEGDQSIRDRTAPLEDGTMRWTVSLAPIGSDESETILDAVWTRPEEDSMPRPIDSNRFAPSPHTDGFVRELVIAAPVERVYAAWTDGAAFAAAYGPDRPELRADIDLAIGGRYEWLWDGKRGSNDCQVLSFIPNRMVTFSWNAPPDQPESRAQRTWVVVEFEPVDAGTQVRLTHLGFGEAEHWRVTEAYFGKAWDHVLGQFATNLGGSAAPDTK